MTITIDRSILTLGSSIKFVAEVVSSNWQNNYSRKVEDYAVLGIPEYWIADFTLSSIRTKNRVKDSELLNLRESISVIVLSLSQELRVYQVIPRNKYTLACGFLLTEKPG